MFSSRKFRPGSLTRPCKMSIFVSPWDTRAASIVRSGSNLALNGHPATTLTRCHVSHASRRPPACRGHPATPPARARPCGPWQWACQWPCHRQSHRGSSQQPAATLTQPEAVRATRGAGRAEAGLRPRGDQGGDPNHQHQGVVRKTHARPEGGPLGRNSVWHLQCNCSATSHTFLLDPQFTATICRVTRYPLSKPKLQNLI